MATNRNRGRNLVLGIVAGIGFAGLAGLVVRSHRGSKAEAPRAAFTPPQRSNWAVGQARLYDVQFSLTQRTRRKESDSLTAFSGVTRWTLEQQNASQRVFRVDLVSARSADLMVLERHLVSEQDLSELSGASVWIVKSREGDVLDVRFKKNVQGTASVFLEQLALQSSWTLREEGSFIADERTAQGTAISVYTDQGDGRWERARSAYRSVSREADGNTPDFAVDSHASLRVEHHELVSLEHSETLADVAQGRTIEVHLSLAQTGDVAPGRLAEVPTQNEVDREQLALENELDNQIAGLTSEQMEAFIRGFDPTASDLSQWLQRMQGLLLKHPELAYRLIPLFFESGSDHERRSLVLDLLWNAGLHESQDAMRQILNDPRTRGQKSYTQYAQRLSFLLAPEPETAAFALEQFQQTQGDVKESYGFALGAIARQTSQVMGDHPRAVQYNDVLRQRAQTASGEQQYFALQALGNTGLSENLPVWRQSTRSPNKRNRHAAAIALSRVAESEAEELLFALAADADFNVSSTAIDSLSRRPKSAALVERLRMLVSRGGLRPANFGGVVPFAKAYLSEFPTEVLGLCEALLAKSIPNRDVRVDVLAIRQQAKALQS